MRTWKCTAQQESPIYDISFLLLDLNEVSISMSVKEKRLTELIGVLHLHRRSWNIIMMSRLLHVGHCADRATHKHTWSFIIYTFILTPFSIIIVLCCVGRCEGMTVTHSLVLAKVSLALTSWLPREDTLPRFFSRRAAFSFAKSDILLRNID